MRQARAEIQRTRDEEALSRAAAGLFVRLAREAVADRGRFTVALAGGSTPRSMLQLLAAAPFRDRVAWDKVEFFWGDERSVPPDHPDSNHAMAQESLLRHLPVESGRVHRMRAERKDLDAAATEYQAEIASVFGVAADGPAPAFDLVFLGMGPDGHTASLFPHTEALASGGRWVAANQVPGFGARLTMTPELVNRASCVAFLVKGADKAERLAEVLEGPRDTGRLPSQLIRPMGRLVWMVDAAAASRLRGVTSGPRAWIAPSILSADFRTLGRQVEEAECDGVDRIHVDVMDGHFVPNISMGPLVVRWLRTVTRLPLETHVMITDPEKYVEPFADAGSDSILFHLEATDDPRALARRIRELGMGVGVAVSPPTPSAGLEELVGEIDLALVMTVQPGFGGQRFQREMLPKVAAVRERIRRDHPRCELEVDGGITAENVSEVVEAGADVFVAGSSVFGAPDGIAAAVERLRRAIPA